MVIHEYIDKDEELSTRPTIEEAIRGYRLLGQHRVGGTPCWMRGKWHAFPSGVAWTIQGRDHIAWRICVRCGKRKKFLVYHQI